MPQILLVFSLIYHVELRNRLLIKVRYVPCIECRAISGTRINCIKKTVYTFLITEPEFLGNTKITYFKRIFYRDDNVPTYRSCYDVLLNRD